MTDDIKSKQPFLIVGIGASAGGLDALQRFLAALPADFGFALVFIQHLSSKHKSLLPELLGARRPSLVIQQISDGLKVQPGRLYLAPPGREVRLQNGLFETTVHTEGLIHLPIDEFLSSLAEHAGDHSIAVIFSGAGTDGARGCQNIRAAGGTVFVQDPQTAEFDSMPLAAIATGQADAVLSPGDIVEELLKLQGTGHAAVSRELPIAAEEFDGFFRVLREKAGSRFDHYKKSVVSRRIKRRMYLHGLPTVKEYLDLISASDAEAALLASDLMIGVTSFFRDRVAWKALNVEAVRKIAAENSNVPVRVWTPASATGEEAYSIAMMLLRELDLAGEKRDIHVFATDVNDRALERAREGKYPASITADVPHEYVQKYFTSADDGNCLVINKDVRESVVFAKQDLLTDPPFSKLDLIICRNFLIYLEPEAQEKCIKLFHYALNNGGYLFLGNAETVGRKSMLFKTIGHKQCRVYRKLETKPASRLPISVPYATERKALPYKQAQTTEQARSVIELIQEKLLEGHGPASVAIDQNYEIIYHNGPTNRYLRQPRGVPTQNLLELLPDSLRNRIRGAIYRSGREERPVTIRTSMAGDDSKKRQVSFKVMKVRENIYVVVFQEKGVSLKEEAAETLEASAIEETAIRQLENELSATRADLQSHIEQLKSMNEEFQSSNEELQAANEELETSREELQSLNEELLTVNSQLQGKIEEQDATNNDLNNFLASTNIPTIFLDQQFKVKRFTPAMLKLIKLLPSDAGRPIVDMSQENLGPDLISDAQSVLESLVPERQELGINGSWYVRTILPYRTADNRIEGVVITYNDVSDLKRSEEHTRHLASFPELNPNPICEVHSSGKVTFCNPATEKVLANLGMGTEDLTVFLPEDMDDILHDLGKKEEMSLYRERVIRGRVFGMTVHLAPQFEVVRIYAYDITERKRAEEELRKSEELFRLAMNNVPSPLGIYDADRRYTFVNTAGLQRLGKPLDAIVGRRIDEMYDEETRRAFWPSLMRAYETGEPQTVECTLDWPTGRHAIIITFVPMLRDGQVYQVLNFSYDITERKKAEEVQGRLAAIVESADDAIIGKDLDGIIQTWNVGAERIFGYKAEEVIGKPISLLVPPGHIDEVPEILARIKQGGHIENFETVRMRKDGTIIPVLLKFSAIKDASGRVIGASKIAHDITERKRAEEALRKSEERYHSLFNTMDEGFCIIKMIFDAEGRPIDYRFLEVNAALEKQTGLHEATGKLMRELAPAHEAHWFEIYGKIALTGEPLRFVNEARALHRWYDVYAYRVGRPEERQVAILFNDISAHKRAEEALRQGEERLRYHVENSPLAVVEWDADFIVTRWAGEAEKIFGWSAAETVGKPIMDLRMIFEEDIPIVQKTMEKLTDGVSRHVVSTNRNYTKDGKVIHCTWYNTVLLDAAGKMKSVMSQVMDITERKQAEEALRASEARFRTLFETMTEGFSLDEIILDDAGKPVDLRYLSVNPAFERHTGLKAEDITGRTTRELFPEAEPVWFERYGKVALTGKPIHFEERFGPLNKWFEVSAYRTEPGRFAVVFFDITERKKSEADLLKLSENMAARNLELEFVNKELESFIYSVSHDLRAPIRTMSGFAKILHEDYAGKLDAQAQDYLKRILRGSDKSTQLIDDLLRLSKISRQEVDRIDVNLSKKASKVAEDLREMNPGRKVEVVVQEGLTASADPRLIELVLSNLIGNAWKFTSKTEKARIEFGAVDSLVRIAECGLRNAAVTEQVQQGKTVYFIRDNGAGFDMTYADKMFWPFHRLHAEQEFEGTGIGLTIVERVIRRHGGKVWAEGEVGKGAVIYFTL